MLRLDCGTMALLTPETRGAFSALVCQWLTMSILSQQGHHVMGCSGCNMLHTLLIANRGEIVCRIIHTCKVLGIRTVAIYSDADVGARHVRMADEAVHIGPSPLRESYLNIEAMLQAARRTGADAIHPGFGFLAENSAFAEACREAGLIFVGPTAEAIAAMGNKQGARERVERVG